MLLGMTGFMSQRADKLRVPFHRVQTDDLILFAAKAVAAQLRRESERISGFGGVFQNLAAGRRIVRDLVDQGRHTELFVFVPVQFDVNDRFFLFVKAADERGGEKLFQKGGFFLFRFLLFKRVL